MTLRLVCGIALFAFISVVPPAALAQAPGALARAEIARIRFLAPTNLWNVFSATVDRCGANTAVEIQRPDRLDSFTYRQLHDMASAWAAWLAQRGVGVGDRCAILAANDAHWCAVYLGLLKRGAVAVPLDTNYTAAQVATIVRDSGAKLVIASDKYRAAAGEAGVAVENLHQEPWNPSRTTPVEPVEPVRSVHAGSTAVILYTSGTTSDPKGVVLTHANLLAERDAAFGAVKVSERDAVLGVLPLFHSLAQLANLLLPFAVGARVVYLETLNSTDLIRALSERRITIFACVPQFFYLIHQRVVQQAATSDFATRTAFRLLLALNFRLRRAGINLGPVFFRKVHDVMGRDIRLLITGGSKFDPEVGRDLYSLGFTIRQAYGLTETSAAATISTPDEAHIDTVGRPLPGVEVKLVDGEIAIRGAIVMKGYHNRPEATAEAIKDGWLYTGDLGRIEDGRITITGRKKEIIVLASGKNIYPEEIEAHYRKSPFVKEICVMGLADPGRPTSERLFGVVVPDLDLLRQKKIVNAGDLIRFEMEGLAAGLPAHKRVLGYDIWFEPLPRTSTQKVKRYVIERRVRERKAVAAAPAPAIDPVDRAWLDEPDTARVVGVIRARLKAGARLFADANLELDLGLDSMERIELLTELEQRLGVKVDAQTAQQIFTVRQLVDAVAGQETTSMSGESGTAKGESWAVLLRELPPATDPELAGLLRPRPIAAPLLHTVVRLLRAVLFRVELTGLEHLPTSGAYIVSPNHQSYLDPFFLCPLVPFSVFEKFFFVGAVEYFETPLTKWCARMINLVPVDPDSNLVPAMKAGAFGLAHGRVLVLFPEGERSIDGTVKKFKKGAPILAQHVRVPIVPVAINGAFEVWPRGGSFDWGRLRLWSRHRIRIQIGAPMTCAEDASYNDTASALRERVDAMWQGLQPYSVEMPNRSTKYSG